jgi:energy-coupling factor transporter ATP-binding protein EcfA2
MSNAPGRTILLLGAPGSGKSTLTRGVLQFYGSGLIALAPGLTEYASYREFDNKPEYRIKGFDDPNFFPSMGSLQAEGYDELLSWLRGVYSTLSAEAKLGNELRFRVLATDTLNQMAQLAMNKTFQHLGVDMPPPAMSPNGAAFWGYVRSLMEQLTRICRSIRGLGLHWVASCHVAEKEMKETAMANPDRLEEAKSKVGIVPAISGGFRDVVAGEFDLVFHTGVTRNAEKQPVYFLRWQSSDKRPTKVRGVYGALATGDKMRADWPTLEAKLREIEGNG